MSMILIIGAAALIAGPLEQLWLPLPQIRRHNRKYHQNHRFKTKK